MNTIDDKHDEFWDIASQYGLEKAIIALKDAGFELNDIMGFIENHWNRL